MSAVVTLRAFAHGRNSRPNEPARAFRNGAVVDAGLGRYMLDWAIDTAWSERPRRAWVHTCTLDHPAALAVYQKAGFVPYDQETIRILDPGPPEAG